MRLWVFKPHFSTIFQKYTRVFAYPDILHTGKKVRLQIHIDHKMFDMFTSRNVKKNLTSDQILEVRGC